MRLLLSIPLLLLPVAAAELANCRQVRTGGVHSVSWEFDGRGGISLSSDAPAAGTVALVCRAKFSQPVRAVTIQHRHVLVSFLPSATRSTGSGLTISAGPCSVPYVRVAGEDWIEAGARAWTFALPAPAKRVDVRLEAVDASSKDPLRIDLANLEALAGPAAGALPCSTISAEPPRGGPRGR